MGRRVSAGPEDEAGIWGSPAWYLDFAIKSRSSKLLPRRSGHEVSKAIRTPTSPVEP